VNLIPDCITRGTETVVQQVTNVLEERAIQANAVTPHELSRTIKTIMTSTLAESGIYDIANRVITVPPQVQPASLFSVEYPYPARFTWGGKFRKLPEVYSLPKGTLLVAWQHWCCEMQFAGNRIPPLRKVLNL
jgi:hypothetical protein